MFAWNLTNFAGGKVQKYLYEKDTLRSDFIHQSKPIIEFKKKNYE